MLLRVWVWVSFDIEKKNGYIINNELHGNITYHGENKLKDFMVVLTIK